MSQMALIFKTDLVNLLLSGMNRLAITLFLSHRSDVETID